MKICVIVPQGKCNWCANVQFKTMGPNLHNIVKLIYNNVMTYGRFATDLR